jgi:hypothetical protein
MSRPAVESALCAEVNQATRLERTDARLDDLAGNATLERFAQLESSPSHPKNGTTDGAAYR